MTWACGARTPIAVPPPAQTDQQPSTAVITPEPEPVRDPPPRAADECALIADPAEPIPTFGHTVRIGPSNPLPPSNGSELLLFGQRYETLVRVDSTGRVRPVLASTWRVDNSAGLVWFVTFCED